MYGGLQFPIGRTGTGSAILFEFTGSELWSRWDGRIECCEAFIREKNLGFGVGEWLDFIGVVMMILMLSGDDGGWFCFIFCFFSFEIPIFLFSF